MNVLLEDAIAAGPESGEFYLLLKNYGMWSKYFGCSGYGAHSSEPLPTPIIDDDTAMFVEKAAIKLKKTRPNVWRLFRLHYVNDLSPDKIASIIKAETKNNREPRRKRRKNYFEYNAAIDSAIRHITASTVRDLLKIAERFIYAELMAGYNQL